jgi:hypothetical protein
MRRAIPEAAYGCNVCRSCCDCHGAPHVQCPDARPVSCAGGCGRMTTTAESCRPGAYCRACAHEPLPQEQRQIAWKVRATIRTAAGGWRRVTSGLSSYTDARRLALRFEAADARNVELIEADGRRPRTRPATRVRPVSRQQLHMFEQARRVRP